MESKVGVGTKVVIELPARPAGRPTPGDTPGPLQRSPIGEEATCIEPEGPTCNHQGRSVSPSSQPAEAHTPQQQLPILSPSQPQLPLPPRTALAASGQPEDDAAASSPAALRCLVVDDHAYCREVCVLLLEAMGHTVCGQADNGAEAVALFEAAQRRGEPFELVLMDISMPEMNGAQATQKIREIETVSRCFIVAVTAHTADDERAICRKCDMDAYVTKPLAIQTLKAVVAELDSADSKTSGTERVYAMV